MKIDSRYDGGPGLPPTVDVIQKNLVPEIARTRDLHVLAINSFETPIVPGQTENLRLWTTDHPYDAIANVRIAGLRIAPKSDATMIGHVVDEPLNCPPILLSRIRIGQTSEWPGIVRPKQRNREDHDSSRSKPPPPQDS